MRLVLAEGEEGTVVVAMLVCSLLGSNFVGYSARV
jgi:hypothetical protein